MIDIKIEKLRQKKVDLEKNIKQINSDIKLKEQYIELLEKVKKVFIEASIISRDKTKTIIENVISDGLNLIHEHKMKFKIVDSTKFQKSGCQFKIEKNGNLSSLICYGGGIRNIISSILRFIFAEYSNPKTNLPLVLDEIGYNISKEYQSKFGKLLSTFSKKFNRQILLITHVDKISEYADKIFLIKNVDNKSIIEEKNVQ